MTKCNWQEWNKPVTLHACIHWPLYVGSYRQEPPSLQGNKAPFTSGRTILNSLCLIRWLTLQGEDKATVFIYNWAKSEGQTHKIGFTACIRIGWRLLNISQANKTHANCNVWHRLGNVAEEKCDARRGTVQCAGTGWHMYYNNPHITKRFSNCFIINSSL